MGTTLNRAVIVIAAAQLVSACNGDDASIGAPPPPPPPPSSDSTLLPFVTAGGDLKLLNPATPSVPAVTTDTGLDAPDLISAFQSLGTFRILAGAYDGASNILNDRHYRYLVYVKQGQVFRVSLLQGSVTTPQRISSVSNACGLRSLLIDYSNPLNRGLRVETPGMDNNCLAPSDNGTQFFRLNAPDTEPGTAVARNLSVVGSILNADGSLLKVLAQDGPSTARVLRHYDANFTNPMDITTLASGTSVSVGPSSGRTTRYLRLRPAAAANFGVYRYDAVANSIQPLHTFANVPTGFFPDTSSADSSYLYFADENKIWRVPHAGSTPELLHTAPVGIGFLDVTLTTNRIIVLTANSSTGAQGLASLPKTGAMNLTILEPDTFEPLSLFATRGTQVYYKFGTGSTGSLTAVRVVENDSGEVRYLGGDWGGVLDGASASVGGLNPQLNANHLLLGEGDASGLVTVHAVDASSGTIGVTLGVIANALQGFGFNFGRYVLINVEIDRSPNPSDYDVYFADAQTGNSLRAVAGNVGADDAVAQ